MPERPNMWYIFEKRIVQGYEKWYSHVSNTQIQKYKYKIHKYSIRRSARKTQHVVYFWKEDFSRISKIIFPCVKHANTKIQIYKYTNTAYDKVPERPSMWYNTVAVLSLCQLSIVECSKSSKDFCTEIHSGLLNEEFPARF